MTRQRYSKWILIWKWFHAQKRSSDLELLYDLLNAMWQEDRKSTTPEQLAAYSQPFEAIENDPEFKKFLKGLDQAFEN